MVLVIGKISVPTPGTPIQVTAQAVWGEALAEVGFSTQFLTVQAILFQAWKANTGQVYLGKIGMNKGTGAKVMSVLVTPTTAGIPSVGASNHLSLAGIDVSAFYLDADVATDGVLVSALVS